MSILAKVLFYGTCNVILLLASVLYNKGKLHPSQKSGLVKTGPTRAVTPPLLTAQFQHQCAP